VDDNGGYAIRLDGRPMRLPGGPALLLDSEALAVAIAAEWQQAGGEKGGTLQAEDVPLTRIAGTAQERVAKDPATTVQALARYAQSDLLCYRANSPDSLVVRQAELWQPWLDRATRLYGVSFRVVQGVMPVVQPAETIIRLGNALAVLPPGVLAGLGIMVPATGSLVLGLAVADGAMDADEASALALLDERFQAEKWGEDSEAAARRLAVAADIDQATRFIRLSQQKGALRVSLH
jgi:chaperone required for assembly of F1-ATPase